MSHSKILTVAGESPLPPYAQSDLYADFDAAAQTGRLQMQHCLQCGRNQYPPREICRHCLSDALEWRDQSGTGQLLAETTLHHSVAAYFQDRMPWRIGIVQLDIEVSVIAHVHAGCPTPPSPVIVRALIDRGGHGVLFAFPAAEVDDLPDDPRLLEFQLR